MKYAEFAPDRKVVSRDCGFTLVELLVVIGIIAVLISILLPSLSRAREEGRAIKCASQLQQIGVAVQLYMSQYKGFVGPWRNATFWQDENDRSRTIDPDHVDAYWGVIYATTANLPKQLFNCPSSTASSRGDWRTSPGGTGLTFDEGNLYTSYAQNCYGGKNGGPRGTDTFRIATFGDANEIALFHRKNSVWHGRNMTRMKFASKTIFAHDGYESVVDGNGDTFNDWYQHVSPDRAGEYLRHNKRANVLFCDGHVERMDRDELKEERLYTGRKW